MFLTQGYGLHGTAVRDRNQSEIPNLRCSREMSILAYRSRERSSNSKVTSVLHADFSQWRLWGPTVRQMWEAS